jgi:hypothetical protein
MADEIVNDGRVQADVRAEEEAAKAAKASKADDDKAKPAKS